MKKYPVLVALMANFDITQADIARVINKDKTTVGRKLKGKDNSRFFIEEAHQITEHINKLDEENSWTVDEVFFSDLVACVEQKVS